jgi:hypothetical protein
MRASTSFVTRPAARTAWLSLAAGALALTIWGLTLFANPQPATDLAQRPALEMQLADGGGGKPTG